MHARQTFHHSAPSLSYPKKFWNSKMAQWVMMLASQSDDLSSIPSMHTVKGENQVPKGVLYRCTAAHRQVHTHMHTHHKYNKNKREKPPQPPQPSAAITLVSQKWSAPRQDPHPFLCKTTYYVSILFPSKRFCTPFHIFTYHLFS